MCRTFVRRQLLLFSSMESHWKRNGVGLNQFQRSTQVVHKVYGQAEAKVVPSSSSVKFKFLKLS